MALILNIETSTETCSVALAKNGKIIAVEESKDQRSHASILTVLIDRLLRGNQLSGKDLDAVAVSKGPGSYTGLRIGVSAAKGICYGAGKPLIAINTLQSMMAGLWSFNPEWMEHASENTRFCPMLDARRQEVYMAVFHKNGDVVTETSAVIIDDTSFQEALNTNPIVFFGNGSGKCKSLIHHPNAIFLDHFEMKAASMLPLSEKAFQENHFEDLAYFEPFYLKDFVATIPKRKVI